MKPRLFFFLLFLVAFGAGASVRPNVVIIYADDMGFGDLHANAPDSKIPTPNLDQLAADGLRFSDGHSSSGICSPSRFALLTGQHHWRRFHEIVKKFGPSVFYPDDFTLPKMFKSKGYNTACIGKWHLGWDWEAIRLTKPKGADETVQSFDWSQPVPGGPLAQGFDYYFGDGTINFPPYAFMEKDRFIQTPTHPLDPSIFEQLGKNRLKLRAGPAADEWNPYDVLPALADRAVAWIAQQDPRTPFFLYLPLTAPHEPIVPTAEFRGKSGAGFYGDLVCEVDDVAGQVLAALKAGGFSDNTLVVFTADNGPEKTAYSRLEETGHWSSGPFRGLKRDVWEGGHRVPFVVRWPGHTQAGAVSGETVSQVDLAATFASLLDYPLASTEAIDSYNLLPLLEGRPTVHPFREATVQNTYEESYGLRRGDWVLINSHTGERSACPAWFDEERGYSKETTPELLYNLKDDPAQRHNLYATHPEIASEMTALLNRYLSGEGCAPHARMSTAGALHGE